MIQLSISIADRLVQNEAFRVMPEAAVLQRRTKKRCPGCESKWRQRARRLVPDIMENIARNGDAVKLYNIVSGMYGNREDDYRLPGTSKIVINKEGLK